MDYACLDAAGNAIASSEDPAYILMEEIAPRYGLKTLRTLGDGGHVELDGWEQRRLFLDVTGGSSTV
jgi:hypothetical protein